MDVKTPVPGEASRNGTRRNSLGIAAVAGIVTTGVGVMAFLGLPAPASVATHAEVRAVADKLSEHVTAEGDRVGRIETDTAVHARAIEQHDKMLERVLNMLDAVYANQATMMREVEIPSSRIAKPKER